MILYSVDNGVASIVLNRPEKRNALNDALIAEIKRALGQASLDESVRAIVISGAGKDFCSGAGIGNRDRLADTPAGRDGAASDNHTDLALEIVAAGAADIV